MTASYKSNLSAGQGMIAESRILLELWQPSMGGKELYYLALASGRFPTVSAKRLQNMVIDVFAPRFLTCERPPAVWLKAALELLSERELAQVMYLYACRDNLALGDFVREVYWPTYAAGRNTVTNEDARRFIERLNLEGKLRKPWGEAVVRRMASYLTGTCADFGLLESGRKVERKILPFRMEDRVAALLAYDLHLGGLGDNRLLAYTDWQIYGLEREDVLAELRRLALRGLLIIQAAGEAVKIHWPQKSMEEVIHAVTQSQF